MPMKALLQPLEAVAGFDDLKKQLKKELGIVSGFAEGESCGCPCAGKNSASGRGE